MSSSRYDVTQSVCPQSFFLNPGDNGDNELSDGANQDGMINYLAVESVVFTKKLTVRDSGHSGTSHPPSQGNLIHYSHCLRLVRAGLKTKSNPIGIFQLGSRPTLPIGRRKNKNAEHSKSARSLEIKRLQIWYALQMT